MLQTQPKLPSTIVTDNRNETLTNVTRHWTET